MDTELDDVFSDIIAEAKSKFGDTIYEASERESHICVVPVPLAFGWLIGGVNGAPVGRVYGIDGFSGNYKTALMIEQLRWTVLNDGFAVYVDAEEKLSDTMIRGLLSNVPLHQRRRFQLAEAHSIDQWQQHASFWLEKSKTLKKRESDALAQASTEMERAELLEKLRTSRVWINIVVDSLTGRDTLAEQQKLKEEGFAGARGFSEQAMAISRFYKKWSSDGSYINLGHVQHSKKSQDPNAKGDSEIIANGGEEPRYNSSYHLRCLSRTTPDMKADGAHVEIRVKCLKSGLGEDKRSIVVKVRWVYHWMNMPRQILDDEGASYKCEPDPVSLEKAVEYFNAHERFMPYDSAVKLMRVMGLENYYQGETKRLRIEKRTCEITAALADPDIKPRRVTVLTKELEALNAEHQEIQAQDGQYFLPVTEEVKVQDIWFDWDWSLGWILHNFRYGDSSVGDKAKLSEILPFTEGNKGYVKSSTLFGDDKQHTFTELGEKVREDKELYAKVENYLGIQRYQTLRQMAHFSSTAPTKKKGSRFGT